MGEKNTGNASANLLAIGVLGILALLVMPLPGSVVDALLGVNIAAAILILLVTLRVAKPLDFSVFPAMLLIITLFRLGLNVATTRLILLHGGKQDGAVGHIIKAFGEFAVGGSIIVGAVVFLILLVVNFMVITKGAGRVSEVAARFTLDALPGKQMAIDADLNAGYIDESEARRRRDRLSSETEFFGAMDGASKFVRGDAIAGLIITGINIIGGFMAGVVRDGMGFGEAIETFTILTIGDGLVSQMPALVISTAAGIIITRAGSGDLSRQLSSQILGNSQVLATVAGALILLGLMPGMPKASFIALAIGAFYLSRRAKKKEDAPSSGTEEETPEAETGGEQPERIEDSLRLDALELELGIGLVNLIETDKGGDLPKRVTALRKQLATELGLILPAVHLKDSLALDAAEYRISLRGMEIGRAIAYGDRLMVLHPAGEEPQIPGVAAKEPAFGLPARWVEHEQRSFAEQSGLTVVDPSSVITTHLGEVLRRNAQEFIGRQEVQELLNIMGRESPRLVEDVIPEIITRGDLGQVLRGLLREGVSIRDLRSILEAVADAAVKSKEISFLVEQTRLRLSRQITSRIADENNKAHVITFERASENLLRQSLGQEDGQIVLAPDIETARQLIDGLEIEAARLAALGHPCVVLASPDLRYALYSFASRFVPDLWVISARELTPGTSVEPIGMIRLTPQAAAA
jgi:flagellar biosynthesis protein FlhA